MNYNEQNVAISVRKSVWGVVPDRTGFQMLLLALLLNAAVLQALEVKCYKNEEQNGSGVHLQLPIPLTQEMDSFECEALITPPQKVKDHGLRCGLLLSADPQEIAKEDGAYWWGGLEFYKGISSHLLMKLDGKTIKKDNWTRLPYNTPVLLKLKYSKSSKIFSVSYYVEGEMKSEFKIPYEGSAFNWKYFSIVSLSSKQENISDSCGISNIKVNGQEILPAEMRPDTQKKKIPERKQN